MRQRVKLFQETRSQTLSNGDWVDDIREGPSGEDQINAWLDLTGAKLESWRIDAHRHTAGSKAHWTLFHVVTYSDASSEPIPDTPDVPAIAVKVPVMQATYHTPSGPQKIKVAAGVFGVVPGSKLHPDDVEDAPLPVTAGYDFTKYGELFT